MKLILALTLLVAAASGIQLTCKIVIKKVMKNRLGRHAKYQFLERIHTNSQATIVKAASLRVRLENEMRHMEGLMFKDPLGYYSDFVTVRSVEELPKEKIRFREIGKLKERLEEARSKKKRLEEGNESGEDVELDFSGTDFYVPEVQTRLPGVPNENTEETFILDSLTVDVNSLHDKKSADPEKSKNGLAADKEAGLKTELMVKEDSGKPEAIDWIQDQAREMEKEEDRVEEALRNEKGGAPVTIVQEPENPTEENPPVEDVAEKDTNSPTEQQAEGQTSLDDMSGLRKLKLGRMLRVVDLSSIGAAPTSKRLRSVFRRQPKTARRAPPSRRLGIVEEILNNDSQGLKFSKIAMRIKKFEIMTECSFDALETADKSVEERVADYHSETLMMCSTKHRYFQIVYSDSIGSEVTRFELDSESNPYLSEKKSFRFSIFGEKILPKIIDSQDDCTIRILGGAGLWGILSALWLLALALSF